jgi:transcriptional regulator with XRE-family HTH domain
MVEKGRSPPRTLPERIRARRLQLGRRATDVCARAGISRSYYWSLENRLGLKPSAEALDRIARALDTTATYLLGQSGVPQRGAEHDVAPTLAAVAARLRLGGDETAMLSRIVWEGRRPQTESDWLFLVEAIRRAVG